MISPYFTDSHHAFREKIRQFVTLEILPYANEWEERQRIPRFFWHKMGELQFLGVNYPKSFGGSNLDFFHTVVLLEELTRSTLGGLVAAVTMHQFMALNYIHRYGSQSLKRNYLMPGILGEKVAGLAIAEPGAGSDVAALRTRAVFQDGVYVLNGEKTFVTNGILGDYLVLAAKTNPQAGTGGISLFVVDADADGLQAKKIRKMGWHCADIANVTLENVRVPESQRIGQANMGFYYIMDCFLVERLVAAVAAVATADICLEKTIEYIRSREAFNRKLSRFQAIRHNLSDLAGEIEAARQLTYNACWQFQEGQKGIQQCSMAKLYSADLAKRVADVCLQYFGGNGYSEEYAISRLYRDARAASLVGGTSEILREIISKLMIDNFNKNQKRVVNTRRVKPKTPEVTRINQNDKNSVNPVEDVPPISVDPLPDVVSEESPVPDVAALESLEEASLPFEESSEVEETPVDALEDISLTENLFETAEPVVEDKHLTPKKSAPPVSDINVEKPLELPELDSKPIDPPEKKVKKPQLPLKIASKKSTPEIKQAPEKVLERAPEIDFEPKIEIEPALEDEAPFLESERENIVNALSEGDDTKEIRKAKNERQDIIDALEENGTSHPSQKDTDEFAAVDIKMIIQKQGRKDPLKNRKISKPDNQKSIRMNKERTPELTEMESLIQKPLSSLTVADIFESLPHRYKPKPVGKYQTLIQYKISGTDGGNFTVQVQGDKCTVVKGLIGKAKCVVETNTKTYIEMETGKTNPQIAFMMGEIKISNVPEMMRFIKMFKKLPDT